MSIPSQSNQFIKLLLVIRLIFKSLRIVELNKAFPETANRISVTFSILGMKCLCYKQGCLIISIFIKYFTAYFRAVLFKCHNFSFYKALLKIEMPIFKCFECATLILLFLYSSFCV